jgi:hypothetical protein
LSKRLHLDLAGKLRGSSAARGRAVDDELLVVVAVEPQSVLLDRKSVA